MALKGAGDVIANLKKVQSEFAKKRRQALTRIGVIVKADSVKMTPVDTTNLRGAAFSEVQGQDSVIIGYDQSAAYAPYVHEDLEAHHDVGEAKFLEKAVKKNQKRILEELAKGGIT